MSEFLGSEVSALVGARQDRDQLHRQIGENASREAFNSYSIVTTGVGDVTPAQPIMFDARFTQEPFITTGLVLVKQPDLTRYRLPLVTAGVLRWVTEPLRPKTPGRDTGQPNAGFVGGFVAARSYPPVQTATALNLPDPRHPLAYLGAFLYFTIAVEPIKRPRTDGRNLQTLLTELQTAKAGSTAFTNLTQMVKEARQAIDLLSYLPDTTIRHSITFRGVAQKKLDSSVDALARTRTELPPAGA